VRSIVGLGCRAAPLIGRDPRNRPALPADAGRAAAASEVALEKPIG